MYKPKRDKHSGGGYGNKRFTDRPGAARRVYSKGDRGSTQAFEAVCGSCGKDCKVPFRPTGKKPVLCINCFKQDSPQRDGGFGNKKRFGNDRFGGDRGGRFERPAFGGGRGNDDQLRAINAKLDEILRELRDL